MQLGDDVYAQLAALQQRVKILEAGGAGVSSVSATAPLTSTGGATPTLAIDPASHGGAGSMSAAHFDLLDLATSSADANSIPKRGSSAECAFGALTCTTLDASSTVTCTGVTSSGPVSCTTLTASGAASCASLTVGGKAIQGYSNSTKTASFTAAFGGFYEFTPSAGSQVVTCPDPTGASGQGFTILALNTTAFSISLSGKTVNGVASLTVTPSAAYQAITVVALSDGNFAAVGI